MGSQIKRKKNKLKESHVKSNVPTYYLPKIEHPSEILSRENWEFIWSCLPNRFTIQDPVFMFSTNLHGYSMTNFLLKFGKVYPQLIILKTNKKEIFGAFLTESWTQNKNLYESSSYWGGRESFVWTISPKTSRYYWTEGNNDFIMRIDKLKALCIGGNGTSIYMDSELLHGHSKKSDTFQSPQLTIAEDFEIEHMEMYSIS